MNLFGVKIKTYDWVPKDEIALVTPGIDVEVTDEKTGHKEKFQVKKPKMVRSKINSCV